MGDGDFPVVSLQDTLQPATPPIILFALIQKISGSRMSGSTSKIFPKISLEWHITMLLLQKHPSRSQTQEYVDIFPCINVISRMCGQMLVFFCYYYPLSLLEQLLIGMMTEIMILSQSSHLLFIIINNNDY